MPNWPDLAVELHSLVFSFMPTRDLKRVGHLCKYVVPLVREYLYRDVWRVVSDQTQDSFKQLLAFTRVPAYRLYGSRVQSLTLCGMPFVNIEHAQQALAPVLFSSDIPQLLSFFPALKTLRICSVQFHGISFGADVPRSVLDTLLLEDVVVASAASNILLLFNIRDQWKRISVKNCRWQHDIVRIARGGRLSVCTDVLDIGFPRRQLWCYGFTAGLPRFDMARELWVHRLCACGRATMEQTVANMGDRLISITIFEDAFREVSYLDPSFMSWTREATSVRRLTLEFWLDDPVLAVPIDEHIPFAARSRVFVALMRYLPPRLYFLHLKVFTSSIATPKEGDDTFVDWTGFAEAFDAWFYPDLRIITVSLHTVPWEPDVVDWNTNTVAIMTAVVNPIAHSVYIDTNHGRVLRFVLR